MSAQHVPISELPSFLERFSRGHEGWLTRVEVGDGTRRGSSDERRLDSIIADTGRNRLLVFLDHADRESSPYSIDAPTEVWRERSGETLRLQVASAGGSKTLIECHPAGHGGTSPASFGM